MKYNTDTLKQYIAEKLSCSTKDIKRLSKSRLDDKTIRRVFEVASHSQYELITSSGDDNVVGFNPMAQVSVSKKPFSDYCFAIDTVPTDGYYRISIIKKNFWAKHGHSDDRPCPIEHLLPSYIGDLNESSDMAIEVTDANWTTALNDLLAMGIDYENTLATYLNAIEQTNTFYIK